MTQQSAVRAHASPAVYVRAQSRYKGIFMNKQDVILGKVYITKINNRFVPVKLLDTNALGGWTGINTITQRTVHVRTAKRLREEYVPVAITEI